MFEQATLSSGPAAKRVWTTCLGVTGQALVVTFMILAPMIWPEVLPQAKAIVQVVGPVSIPKALPPAGTTRVQPRAPESGSRPLLPWKPPTQPSFVPKGVAEITDEPAFAFAPFGSIASDASNTPPGNGPGVPGGTGTAQVIPPPPPPEKPAPSKAPEPPARIVQTSQLDQAQILRRVEPVYPEIAIRMRVAGTVQLRGIIGTDGRIRELKVLGGHPLLVKAAVDAVSQWIYKPTRLSGQPVEVDAPILVTFHLK